MGSSEKVAKSISGPFMCRFEIIAPAAASDTSIMELADDISYGVHDLEDALALQLVTFKQWNDEVITKMGSGNIIHNDVDFFNEKLFSESNKDRKHAISKLIGYFIQDQQSGFYQSEGFSKVLLFVQKNASKCKMKEKKTRNGLRLLITFDNIKSTQQALNALSNII